MYLYYTISFVNSLHFCKYIPIFYFSIRYFLSLYWLVCASLYMHIFFKVINLPVITGVSLVLCRMLNVKCLCRLQFWYLIFRKQCYLYKAGSSIKVWYILYASYLVEFITKPTTLIQNNTTQVYFNSVVYLYVYAVCFGCTKPVHKLLKLLI